MAAVKISGKFSSSRAAVKRLALSRAVSFAGNGAAFIALSSILYTETHSATLVAAAAFATFAIPALLSPIAGLLGDRFDRQKVMLVSELAGAACFVAMSFVGAPALLLLLRVLASFVAAPYVPATAAALPNVVRDEAELPRANAALGVASWAGAVVGPFVAGIMLAGVGGHWVFVVNGVAFLISALLIASVRADFRPSGRAAPSSAEFAAGFQTLIQHPLLRPMTFAHGIIFLGVGVTVPAEIVLSSSFKAGPVGYAAMTGLWAAGGVAGARITGEIADRLSPTRALTGAAGGLAISFLAIATAPLFAVVLLGMTFGGGCQGAWMVLQGLAIQRNAEDTVRSRTFASNEAVEFGGIAVGLLASGLIVVLIGAGGAFAIASAASALGVGILLRGRKGAESFRICSRPIPRAVAAGREENAGRRLAEVTHSASLSPAERQAEVAMPT